LKYSAVCVAGEVVAWAGAGDTVESEMLGAEDVWFVFSSASYLGRKESENASKIMCEQESYRSAKRSSSTSPGSAILNVYYKMRRKPRKEKS
jgi:hypothetical protein